MRLHARARASILLTLCLSFAVAGTVHARGTRDNNEGRRPYGEGYFEWQDQYPGGDQALPYGLGDAVQVLRHAETLDGVRFAVQRLEARGYLRRPDLDGAGTQTGFAFAVLAFEKPGEPITARQPLIVVATRAFEIPSVGWRPATQIYAALFADSAGLPRVEATPTDSGLVVLGDVSGPLTAEDLAIRATFAQPPGGVLVNDEFLQFRYTAYQHPAGTWQYQQATSPGMQKLMSLAYQNVAWNVAGGVAAGTIGFVQGPAMGIASTIVGGYTSGLVAWKTFWLNPPDTTQVRR